MSSSTTILRLFQPPQLTSRTPMDLPSPPNPHKYYPSTLLTLPLSPIIYPTLTLPPYSHPPITTNHFHYHPPISPKLPQKRPKNNQPPPFCPLYPTTHTPFSPITPSTHLHRFLTAPTDIPRARNRTPQLLPTLYLFNHYHHHVC